jgi:hypothetical protein
MFDNKTWYHGITRKAIVAFGVMFNSLNVRRSDTSGNVVQTVRIPLTYAAKNKMLSRIERLPEPENGQYQVQLPRLSFEVIAFEYDGARKINLMNQTTQITNTGSAKRVFAPTPYNLTVNLYAYTKNQDDGLQIFEQIAPAFNPDFNVTVNYIPELGIKHDLPIILNSVSYDDGYEGLTEERRIIIWTYTFTLKLYYYGPVDSNLDVIRTAIVNIFNDEDFSTRINKYTVTTDPAAAEPSDDYRFLETFESGF